MRWLTSVDEGSGCSMKPLTPDDARIVGDLVHPLERLENQGVASYQLRARRVGYSQASRATVIEGRSANSAWQVPLPVMCYSGRVAGHHQEPLVLGETK